MRNDLPHLRHVGIVVSSIEKALPIFVDYLGMDIYEKFHDLKGEYIDKLTNVYGASLDIVILIAPDGNKYELLEYKKIDRPKSMIYSSRLGVSHFALTVTDLGDLYSRRDKFNAEFFSPPLISPNEKVKVAYVCFLNEVLVELVEVLNVH
jgi:hypothetical protein